MSEQKIVTDRCLNFVCIWRREDKTCSSYIKCQYRDKEWLKHLAECHTDKLQKMSLLDLWDLAYFYEYGVIKEPQSQFCFFINKDDNPFLQVYIKRTKSVVKNSRDRFTE